eukprot:scaffold47862_cov28-Tisochrysis_lutea.AAC.1
MEGGLAPPTHTLSRLPSWGARTIHFPALPLGSWHAGGTHPDRPDSPLESGTDRARPGPLSHSHSRRIEHDHWLSHSPCLRGKRNNSKEKQ